MTEPRKVLGKVRTVAGWILLVIGILTTASHVVRFFFTSSFVQQSGFLLFSLGILLLGALLARRPRMGWVYGILSGVLLVVGMVLGGLR